MLKWFVNEETFQTKNIRKSSRGWYRASTERKAKELGICGIVKNEADGTVFAEIEGNEEQIKKMIDWCKKGPPLANVTKIEKEVGDLVNYDSFNVIRK